MCARNQQLHIVILNILEQAKQAIQQLRPLLLVAHVLRLQEVPLLVTNIRGARSPRILRLYALPRLLEQILYLLEAVKSRHLLVTAMGRCRTASMRCLTT